MLGKLKADSLVTSRPEALLVNKYVKGSPGIFKLYFSDSKN